MTAVLAAVTAWCIQISHTHPQVLDFGEEDQLLEQVHFSTDGVLSRQWLDEMLSKHLQSEELASIDIHRLDSALEGCGQVREATVRRIYPDALGVTVREHTPVMRIRVADAHGQPETMLVAQTGHIYSARDYAEVALERLPFVGGVRLRRQSGGYAPIAGMEVVTDLLEQARHYAPELYARFRVVMLDDFDGRTDVPWATIRVRTRGLGDIVFSPEDFNRQISRLVSIVDAMDPVQRRDLQRIDLTPPDRAAVRIAHSPSSPYHRR